VLLISPAAAQGHGFMSYGAAETRLRKMLAASLASGGNRAASPGGGTEVDFEEMTQTF
jgi:hypothetical protein